MNFKLSLSNCVFEHYHRTRNIAIINEFINDLQSINSVDQVIGFYEELLTIDIFHDNDAPSYMVISYEGHILLGYIIHLTITEILCGITLDSIEYSHDKHYHIFKFFYHVQSLLSIYGDGDFHIDPTTDLHNDDITRTYNRMLLTNIL